MSVFAERMPTKKPVKTPDPVNAPLSGWTVPINSVRYRVSALSMRSASRAIVSGKTTKFPMALLRYWFSSPVTRSCALAVVNPPAIVSAETLFKSGTPVASLHAPSRAADARSAKRRLVI